jgi:8-oxo-dGTP diphosphatase
VLFPALEAPFRTTITEVTIDNVPSAGLLIVDGANVVGSRPDGWWRDRAGAAARLRDRLAAAVERGVFPAAVEVVLVVEGKARGIEKSNRLRVLAASGSGDDSIVGVAREARAAADPATVVTADRGLRERVVAEGASVVGPGTLYRWLE